MASPELKGEDPGGGLKFECGVCLKEFSTYWCLQMHITTHDAKKSFDCNECEMNFQKYDELCKHMKQHIFGAGSMTEDHDVCGICGKEYPVSQIAMHKRTHIFKPGLTCKTCGKSFGSSQVLKLHHRTHGNKMLYQCQICGLKFASRNSFTLHWKSHPCNELPLSISSLELGTKTRRDSKYQKIGKHFKCNSCSKILTSSAKVKVHVLRHQLQTETENHETSSSTELDAHQLVQRNQSKNISEIKSVLNGKPPYYSIMEKTGRKFYCTLCKKTISSKVKAERHARNHYFQERRDSCKKVSNKHSDGKKQSKNDKAAPKLELHLKHSSQSPKKQNFTCSECNETFDEIEDFQQHRNNHIREYAVGLMRMLNHKKGMNLSVEPKILLDAVKSAADATHRQSNKKINKIRSESYRGGTTDVPDISDDLDEVSDGEHDSFHEDSIDGQVSIELEYLNESNEDLRRNIQNESSVSLPTIFASPDHSQGQITKQKRDKEFPEVSPSACSSKRSVLSYQEVMKHMITKGNQMVCKVCQKKFYSIERIGVHIKRHLEKGDEKNYLLKNFPDLYTMTSVRVVLERLDEKQVAAYTSEGSGYEKKLHSADGTVFPKDKCASASYLDESDTILQQSTSHSEVVPLRVDLKAPPLNEKYAKSNGNDLDSEEPCGDSDDADQFDGYCSASDEDEEWIPSKPAESTISEGNNLSLEMEFDVSDSDKDSEDGDIHAGAVAAAIAVCGVDIEDADTNIKGKNVENTISLENDRSKGKDDKGETPVVASRSSPDKDGRRDKKIKGVTTQEDGTELNISELNGMKETESKTKQSSSVTHRIKSSYSKVGDMYVCKICSKELNCESKMYQHIYGHFREKCFHCKFCGHSFHQQSLLELHLRIHKKQHSRIGGVKEKDIQAVQDNYYKGDILYKCRLCLFERKRAVELYSHVFDHLFPNTGEDKDVGVSISSEVDTTEKSARIKTEGQKKITCQEALKFIEEENGRFRCLKCGSSLRNLRYAKDHVKRHFLRPTFKCSKCPFLAYNNFLLLRHAKKHNNEKYSKPETGIEQNYDKSFTAKDAMQFIAKTEDKFECTICNSVLSSLKNMKIHVVNHKQSRRFKCPHCEYYSHSRHVVGRHMLQHAKKTKNHQQRPGRKKKKSNEDSSTDSCSSADDMAEELSGGPGRNSSHMSTPNTKSHDDLVGKSIKETAISADETQKNSDSMEKRKLQEKMHGNIIKDGINYRCGICFKKYAGKTKISRHMNLHFREKVYGCRYCGVRVAKKDELSQHEFYHENFQEKYGITEDEIVTVNANFVEHDSFFNCLICSSNLKSRSGAYRHVLNHLIFDKERENMNTVSANEMNTTPVLEPPDSVPASLPRPEADDSSSASVNLPRPEADDSSSASVNSPRPEADDSSSASVNLPRPEADDSSSASASLPRPEADDSSSAPVNLPRPEADDSDFKSGTAVTKMPNGSTSVPCIVDETNNTFKDDVSITDVDGTKPDEEMRTENPCLPHRYRDALLSCSIDKLKFSEIFTTQRPLTNNNENSVSETRRSRLRVRRTPASTGGIDTIDLTDGDEMDGDGDLADDDWDSDYKCDSDSDDSEKEDMNNQSDAVDILFTKKMQDQHSKPVDEGQSGVKPECSQSFSSDEPKKAVIKVVAEKGKSQEQCSVTHTLGLSELNINQKVSNKKPGTCIEKVSSLYRRKTYRLRENTIKIGKMYCCTICKKEFDLKIKCYAHISHHFQERKYPCMECSYSAITKRYLLIHMKSHKINMIDFPCKICKRVFSSIAVLQKHVASHSDEDKVKYLDYLKCETCGEITKGIKTMFRHKLQHLESFKCKCCEETLPSAAALENHAYEMRHFYCEECGKTYANLMCLDNHQKCMHLNIKPFQCDQCGKQFATVSSMKLHLETHNLTHACRECRMTFNTKTELKQHKYVTNHEQMCGRKYGYYCELCNRAFKSESRLECHKLVHKSLAAIGLELLDGDKVSDLQVSQSLPCPLCPKEYPSLIKLKDHLRTHTDVKKYKCDVCVIAMASSSYFKVHKMIHQDLRPYQCELCPLKFLTENYKQKHIKNTHRKEKKVKRMTECDICGKKLGVTGMKYHKLRHDKEKHVKRFPCDECGKKFYTMSQMKCHKQTHSDEKLFMCDICGKFLRTKGTLKEHRKGHAGVKPFKCSTCDKRFKNKAFLQQHLVVHTDVKPHVCKICNKAFRYSDSLKNHLNTHTGEKPYKCDLCGKCFGDRWTRHNHVKNHRII